VLSHAYTSDIGIKSYWGRPSVPLIWPSQIYAHLH